MGEYAVISEEERNEINAVAWLVMEDDELVRCSASLGGPRNLVCNDDLYMKNPRSEAYDPTVRAATRDELAALRAAADANAVVHAGEEFVAAWIAANRGKDE